MARTAKSFVKAKVGQPVKITQGSLAGLAGVLAVQRESQWVIEVTALAGVYVITDSANCEVL